MVFFQASMRLHNDQNLLPGAAEIAKHAMGAAQEELTGTRQNRFNRSNANFLHYNE